MKIGMIVGEFPSLSETFVLNQAKDLALLGHEICVFCDRIGNDPRIDVRSEPVASIVGRTRRWWHVPQSFKQQLAHLPDRLADKISTAADVYWSDDIKNCDVLIAHFGHNGLRLARVKKRGRLSAKIVTIFHGNDVGVHHRSGTMHTYRPVFDFGALNLTVNGVFKKMLVNAGARPETVKVHRMGISCEDIQYRWRPWKSGPLGFLSVGRLIEKKGTEFALRAFAQLASKRPELDWQYTIIGDGPLAGDLKALSRALGLSARVSFLGALPHEQVKTHLDGAHVFVLPSVTGSDGDVEGVPVAIMEAMAAGLVVVSSRHSGIPELVEDRVGGLLSDERDFGSLACDFAWIADHYQACKPITEAARQRVEDDFDNKKLNGNLSEMISSLVETSSIR